MKLSLLTQRLPHERVGADEASVEITSVTQDSRHVGAGSLFVAVHGTMSDGHDYIDRAIDAGATAVCCERMPDARPGVAYVIVRDGNEALAALAAAWYGYPSERLTLVGVTGTNGKTTIATLLYRLFTAMGYPCGLLSTVCNYVIDRPVAATHTTPDALELNALLADMVAAGCEYAFMEVSSHAADQKRIGSLAFDGGIFTNLTRDHLDYHKTFDNYLRAKKSFFDLLPASAFALANVDDRNGLVMQQNTAARRRTFSTRTAADYTATIVEESPEGMELRFAIGGKTFPPMASHFIGRFNASNLAAVFGAAVELGANPDEALVRLSALTPVNGRFEVIHAPRGFHAVIDYAHTPDALVNVLEAIREIKHRKARVITVVGCGGNRDAGKRPIMAREAARRSESLVLTSDNPRHEDPVAILRDMEAGLEDPALRAKTITIVDRREAIRAALAMAQEGDVVLIAGKGHEDYQEICGVKHHFDDHEVVRECLFPAAQ